MYFIIVKRILENNSIIKMFFQFMNIPSDFLFLKSIELLVKNS